MALAETKLFPKNTSKSCIGATGQQRNRQQVRKSSLIHYKIMIDIKLCNFSPKHPPQDHNLAPTAFSLEGTLGTRQLRALLFIFSFTKSRFS